MTEADMARRSDELYYDTNSLHRRALCDMVARREAEIEAQQRVVDRLVIDNTRLRSWRRRMLDAIREYLVAYGVFGKEPGE